MAVHVCMVLTGIILLCLDEFVKNKYFSTATGAAVGITAIIFPVVTVVFASVVYILMYKRRTPQYITAGFILLINILLSDTLSRGVISTVVILAAAYVGYFSDYYASAVNRSTQLWDAARKEAVDNERKRREVSERTDAEIYTARLKERNRIAREIHDNVGHILTRAVVQMQAILVISKEEEIKPYLESVNNTINEAMTNIRRSVHELHDDSIDLSIGINNIATSLKDKFEVEVVTSLDSPVNNEMKQQILGIIKECVTNISKHSNGNKAVIEMVENVTFWRIKVFDNGSSKDLELSGKSDFIISEGDSGIGLLNINSRAQAMGGRASVRGGADGFTVVVTIPKEK
ncbi:MAG: histidine kinase [Clostridia bacterium]|nr:histidine kinase [Clostridia bacterium]